MTPYIRHEILNVLWDGMSRGMADTFQKVGERIYCFHLQDIYSEVEVVGSSATSVLFYLNIRCHIPKCDNSRAHLITV
jgi:hypothetical protein